ncbi:hypothetical protein BIZ82_gp043 [Erwinia phage vB_EamM_EarlPhillipIV]|uniref:Uncharacterized protein n=1 Tax=Erwinia phage vB_EamM_EarlPhillipIV TaxID=1883372 RepID=A0A1B2IC86_9CAUD|nr:hypothetical protein BIZ82_gp043 [Erwinia phage vB_EamM_EarlPhillipIV]ANZ48893.1 hypothetical protein EARLPHILLIPIV_43 [Erwinia phage vB_EamM_EarlPhillipIV]
MNDLYDFYANCLIEVRHPDRAAPLCELVMMAIDNDYEPALEQIYNLEMDDVAAHIDTLEGWIISCAVGLGHRLGIAFDIDSCYRNPRVPLLVLKAVLEDLEDFEDYEHLQAIAESGEPEVIILENMIRYVRADEFFEIGTVIKLIEPRLMIVIGNFLNARALTDQATAIDDAELGRLAKYILAYPENPSVWAFQNAARTTEPNVLATTLVFEDTGVPEERLLEIYAVGLALYDHDNFADAYTALEERLAIINNDGLPPMPILKSAAEVLKTIYEVNDGQAALSDSGL